MIPEIKNRLINFLKANPDKKGCGTLKRGGSGKMCCLGVLTEMYREDHPGVIRTENSLVEHETVKYYFEEEVFASVGYPPSEVIRWADIDTSDVDALIDLNDTSESWDRVVAHLEKMK